MAPIKHSQDRKVEFLDIRRDKKEQSLLQAISDGLKPQQNNAKSLPTLLLYDEQGLKLFEQITYLNEYYLTNAEIEVLTSSAHAIAARIADGSRLVELGSGNLRKVEILLKAFEEAGKRVDYYALDLSLAELERTFSQVPMSQYTHVRFHALHGTYKDGISWLKTSQNEDQDTCVLTLGSSLGNFTRHEAATFLATVAKSLRPGDSLLVGLDACQNANRVFRAYNDSEGVTERFYRNGLEHANQLIGNEIFVQGDWEIDTTYSEDAGRHEASYLARRNVSVEGFNFKAGEKLHLEYAYKYSEEQSHRLWHSAGLVLQTSYGQSDYHVHLLTPSRIGYETSPSLYAADPLPSEKDWQQLWTAWDTVTRAMVPQDELTNKPIKLRNNLIFYLGHIPAFADIHFTKATGCSPSDPAYYHTIFERGIDPDVDNPELCHDHSEIPDTWPPLTEMLDYQARVRSRIIEALRSGQAFTDRRLARGMWLSFEHEAMHLETFLYMLLQSERVLAPPGHARPDFRTMASEAARNRSTNEWHQIPSTQLLVGLDEPESNDGFDWGWDNEKPTREVRVGAFEAQSRPISNEEYAIFLEETQSELLPASWRTRSMNGDHTNGHQNGTLQPLTNGSSVNDQKLTVSRNFMDGKSVRTVFGLVPLKYALDWPVMASYDELASFAKWAGGRIPSYEEAKSIHQYAELRKEDSVKINSSLISAVNGHLVNDGVEESPPYGSNGAVSCSAPKAEAGAAKANPKHDSRDIFIDLTGANVGFSHWYPTPVTGDGNRLRGQADMGGLWEWTSTALAPHPGFKAMDLYPGYTADFFDGKHNIILGGSWGTVPRIAGRKSFVNWYQRNYPYTWATARLVRDT